MDREGKWKILESNYVSRRPWMTARCDKVELPDGRINPEYWVLEFPDWVNVIAITKDGRMVMVRQYRHALGVTSYELCAGVMEKDETPMQAAKRELLEETGFGGGEWSEYMTISANPSNHTNMAHSFLAIGVERISERHLDDTEDLTCHLFSPEEVFGMLRRGEIVQALMAAPLWRFFYEHNA
ncbi:MAG: NUDIX hydrolase [Bacteroidaceae bacterium]|nr:NUDIX hydrolase [Bacteroidaceae bacterium]